MSLLKKTWQIGSFRKVEVRLHSSMLLIVPVMFYLFRPADLYDWLSSITMMIGLLICILLHEMSHTVVAQHLGIAVKQIVIHPLGGFSHLSRVPEKPGHRFLIAAAGPLMSFLLALVLLFFWFTSQFQFSVWGSLTTTLWFLAFMNGVLVVFNLLPIYSLDGGTMLHSFTEMLFGKRAADVVTIVVGIPFLLGLVLVGVWARDYILLLFCILLALGIGTLDPRSRRWIVMGVNYLFKRTGFHHLNEDHDAALRGHTLALQKNPNDTSHLLGRAIAYLNLGERECAAADLEAVLHREPDHAMALELRGEMHAMKKELDQAMEYYQRVRALKPEWAIPYFDCGSIYLERKEYEQALIEFNRAMELERQHPLFYLVRSMAHFRMQKPELAHKDQAEAIRLSPRFALVMTDLNLNVYEGYLDWAQDYYGWIVAKYPRQWMAYQGRADAYMVNQQLEPALADYDQAVSFAPKEATLYLRRGLAHRKAGHSGQAEQDFRRAARLSRKSHLQRRAQQYLAELNGSQTLPEPSATPPAQ